MSKERGQRDLARNAVLWFIAADLVAVVLIAGVGLAVARRIATNEAIRDARAVIETDARHVTPALTSGLLAGDPSASDRFDALVRSRVLSDSLVRVKLWDINGQILYSDDPDLVGETYPLGSEELEALNAGSTAADFSDLSKPENRNERSYGRLVEVYSGVKGADGTPLLFEAYVRFDRLSENSSRILADFAPALLGGLLALFAIQIPLALGLTRRVERAEAEQLQLLQHAVDISERERGRIAADLHDSVVQGLAGSSMSLSAMAAEAEREGNLSAAQRLRDRAAELRQWVRELRSLIVTMVPPRLHEEGLAAALSDLTSSLGSRGVEVALEVDPTLQLSDTTEALLFRTAQEAIRNTLAHAEATKVQVRVAQPAEGRVQLVVSDNGKGIDADELAKARAGGHVGLQLLSELAEQSRGELKVDSSPGQGTTVTLELGTA
ncbi:unannotated protein [freshwater metagenome]|uniref:Oxygen sensor histidine kinase NreB n=1 Tax=freshwater metagenome TaxID=449393 RepID=A0A6J7HSX1_9ZZZZ|nr:hypothetical protein [Actinomycetota bacterium]MSY79946.1 hypothetical protein [Actinomycetota bacterium]